MCERLKQSVLKTDIPERVSGVRIPLPPPESTCSFSRFAGSGFRLRTPASASLRSASLTPASRLNLKTDIPERVSGVRIPLPPPQASPPSVSWQFAFLTGPYRAAQVRVSLLGYMLRDQ